MFYAEFIFEQHFAQIVKIMATLISDQQAACFAQTPFLNKIKSCVEELVQMYFLLLCQVLSC